MTTGAEVEARRAIVEACRAMLALGLTQGTSGNISVRTAEGLLITPSGLPYEAMSPDDIVPMTFAGRSAHRLRPSSEWRFHCDIMAARPEVGAIVHAHSPYATAFAICRQEIPAAHYMIAAAGGPTVRCAAYATFGTAALSRAALDALEGRTCCLLANHGAIALGPSLDRALWLALELETLCRQYAIALQIGRPQILPDAEIARVAAKFRSYGPRSGGDATDGAPRARAPRGTSSGGAAS